MNIGNVEKAIEHFQTSCDLQDNSMAKENLYQARIILEQSIKH